MDMNLGELREIMSNKESWRATVHGVTKSWTQLSDWITTIVEMSQVLELDVSHFFQVHYFLTIWS